MSTIPKALHIAPMTHGAGAFAILDDGDKEVARMRYRKGMDTTALGRRIVDGYNLAPTLADALRRVLPITRAHVYASNEDMGAHESARAALARWDATQPAQSDTRTTADAQTVAYIAIGAHAAIRVRGSLPTSTCDAFQGEESFIDECIRHALMLDRMADALPDGCFGVFCYEIAEPFGERYARELIAHEEHDLASPDAETIARELFDAMQGSQS